MSPCKYAASWLPEGMILPSIQLLTMHNLHVRPHAPCMHLTYFPDIHPSTLSHIFRPLPFFQRLVGKWLPEEMFLELFAVGGCLPGPTSTQVGGGGAAACRDPPLHTGEALGLIRRGRWTNQMADGLGG